jgi:hypothetical protein
MLSPEIKQLEELALLAELARPLVHECNNFLNNLLLQLAISANDLPEAQRSDWERIRQSGKNLGLLLNEWQRYRRASPDGGKTEVQPLVQEIVAELGSEKGAVAVSMRLSPEALYLAGSRDEVKRLYRIMLQYAVDTLRRLGNANPALEIQVGIKADKIIFEIQEVGASPAMLLWPVFDETPASTAGICPLLVAACKSLTERLGGNIRIEKRSLKPCALQLALPAAV